MRGFGRLASRRERDHFFYLRIAGLAAFTGARRANRTAASPETSVAICPPIAVSPPVAAPPRR